MQSKLNLRQECQVVPTCVLPRSGAYMSVQVISTITCSFKVSNDNSHALQAESELTAPTQHSISSGQCLPPSLDLIPFQLSGRMDDESQSASQYHFSCLSEMLVVLLTHKCLPVDSKESTCIAITGHIRSEGGRDRDCCYQQLQGLKWIEWRRGRRDL